MVIFYNILHISALDAFIIWLELNPDWRDKTNWRRREFLLELGTSLVQKNRSRRTKVPPARISAQVQSGAKRGRSHLQYVNVL